MIACTAPRPCRRAISSSTASPPDFAVAPLRVGIAGAGIAGLTTALALARHGIGSTIFERTRELSEVGAGLQVSPNAGRILEGLGLTEALDRAAVLPEAIDLRSGRTG